MSDWRNWTNSQFESARHQKGYIICETSWNEQRQYFYSALDALGIHEMLASIIMLRPCTYMFRTEDLPLAEQIRDELKSLHPALPFTDGYTRVDDLSQLFDTGRLVLGFDAVTGALNELHDKQSDVHWADKTQYAICLVFLSCAQ